MAIASFQATVSRIRDLTHDVRELELTLREPKEIAFKAGQFISFDVPKDGFPYPVTRPYSIASPPFISDRLLLLFNLIPGGPGSTYLHGLREGDPVTFKGPAGSFFLRDDLNKRILFVATGTGIAPFRSMLLTYLERNSIQPVTLVWGLRYERDLYYQDEFRALADRHPQFSFVTTLSRPGPGWTGAKGRVNGLIEERVTSINDLAVYLCGNGRMIKDVTTSIQAKGLCPIYREQYY
ncbi:MAG: FAD-binding oxidoreductase [Nitrospira sp. BO4]|nr:FAD-binding oxidoreductase [Nitrospira sp. BO4]